MREIGRLQRHSYSEWVAAPSIRKRQEAPMQGWLQNWLRNPETLKAALHIMLTAVMGWLSCAFALPGDTLTNPSFTAFAELATERGWSGLFAVAALIGLFGLVAQRRWVKLLSIGGLSTAHGSLACLFYAGHHLMPNTPLSPAVGVYSLIAVMGYLLLWVRVFEK